MMIQWWRDIKIHGSRYPKIQDLWTHGCRNTGIWGSTDIRDPWIYECRSMKIWGYVDLYMKIWGFIDVQILESTDLSQTILLINMFQQSAKLFLFRGILIIFKFFLWEKAWDFRKSGPSTLLYLSFLPP